MRISLVLGILGVSASLGISGCAAIRPPAPIDSGPLVLQKSNERLVISRSGRYVLQATRNRRQPSDQGTQGQFEWLEMRGSPQQARQLLLFIHPLGQSGPSLERQLTFGRAGFFSSERKWLPEAVRVFDEQGNALSREQQRGILAKLIGPETSRNISDAQLSGLLTSVMNVLQAAVTEPDASHHRVYSSDALALSLRIAFDAPAITDDIHSAPSR